jgi:RHS repeat-associated protein
MPCFTQHSPPLNALRQPLLRRLVCTILIVCLGLPAQIWARDGKAGPVSPHIDGNRIAKSVQGSATTTTRYLVDTNNPTGYAQVVEEHESSAPLLPAASGSLTTVYAYGHDLISQDRLTQPGTWHLSYYLYDGGGHVRALATTTAALTDHYTYDAYGILIASTGTTANHYLYRGEQFDPDLKLYYQRARYLNAETGRFWTQDTYEGSPGTPASLHKYLYANSDPVGGWDPSGKFSLLDSIASMVIIARMPRLLPLAGANFLLSAMKDPFMAMAGNYARQYMGLRGFNPSRIDAAARAYDLGGVLRALQSTPEVFGKAPRDDIDISLLAHNYQLAVGWLKAYAFAAIFNGVVKFAALRFAADAAISASATLQRLMFMWSERLYAGGFIFRSYVKAAINTMLTAVAGLIELRDLINDPATYNSAFYCYAMLVDSYTIEE